MQRITAAALIGTIVTCLGSACALEADEEGGPEEEEALRAGDLSDLDLANAAVLASPDGNGPFCAIGLKGIEPGQTTSRVVSYRCAESEALLDQFAPAAAILLMTWYADINYGGSSTRIDGYEGPCDSSGYGISYVGNGWNDRISSFKSWNNCNRAVAYRDRNYGGTNPGVWRNGSGIGQNPSLVVAWVGTSLNDQISSFTINRQ